MCGGETRGNAIDPDATPSSGLDTDAVPLRVGLVVFVSLMFNHSVAADAHVRPGHLHSIQSDPATHKDTISIRERRRGKGGGAKGERQ